MSELFLANAVVLVAAFLQAASGVGFAMVAVPLLAFIDIAYVPGPQLLAMLLLSLAMTGGGWGAIDRPGLKVMALPLMAGTALGALLLSLMDMAALGVTFSIFVLLAVIATVAGWHVTRTTPALMLGGSAAGLMGTVSGMHGPPLAVLYSRAAPVTGRSTIACVFVIGGVLSLASLHLTGMFGWHETMLGLSLLPGVVAGYAVYLAIGRRVVTDTMSRRLMLGLSAASAIALICKTLFA